MVIANSKIVFIPSTNCSGLIIEQVNFEYEIIEKKEVHKQIVFEEKEYLVLEEEVAYSVFSNDNLLGLVILSNENELELFQKEISELNGLEFYKFLLNISSLLRKYYDISEKFIVNILKEDISTTYFNINNYLSEDKILSLREAILEEVILKKEAERILNKQNIYIDCERYAIASLNGCFGNKSIENLKQEIEEKQFIIKDFEKNMCILKSFENKPFKSEKKYQKNFFRGRK